MEIRSSVDEACRLCLRGEGKISVFDEDSKNRTVTPENIYDCVSVKITKDDRLPKGICESCVQSVESWCSFKSTCDKTQETLQGWLLCDNLKKGPEKESTCFSTQKEEIKSSSCNTYKINDGSRGSRSPSLPPHDQVDLVGNVSQEHCSFQEGPSGSPGDVECSSPPRLPSLSESFEPTVPCSQAVEELPNAESQTTEEINGSLSVQSMVTDTSESSSLNVNIVNTTVNISNKTIKDVDQLESNSLSCKYDINRDESPKSPASVFVDNLENHPENITRPLPSKNESSITDPGYDSCKIFGQSVSEEVSPDHLGKSVEPSSFDNHPENFLHPLPGKNESSTTDPGHDFSASSCLSVSEEVLPDEIDKSVDSSNFKNLAENSSHLLPDKNDLSAADPDHDSTAIPCPSVSEEASPDDHSDKFVDSYNFENNLDNLSPPLTDNNEIPSTDPVNDFNDISCLNLEMPSDHLAKSADSSNNEKSTLSQDKPTTQGNLESQIELNELVSSDCSLLDCKNNNVIENGESSATTDILSEIQDKIESLPPCVQDNCKEPVNSQDLLKKPDCDFEKGFTPDIEGNENSVEGEGLSFSDIRIESTSTLTEDIHFSTSFSGNNSVSEPPALEQNLVSCSEAVPDTHIENKNSDNCQISENLVTNSISLAESESSGGVSSSADCSELNNTLEEQPQCTSPTSVTQDERLDESVNEGNSSLEHMEEETPSTEPEITTAIHRRESQFSPSIALNIKQEPLDSPLDEDQSADLPCHIRVKSEFSTFEHEEEFDDYETIDNSVNDQSHTSAKSFSDGSNTECLVCNRKYATVSNFLKHLHTKVHLYNAGLAESSQEVIEDDEPRDSPMLRSRLSGEPLNASSLDEQLLSDTPSISSTSSSKRKIIEHCDLCDTSFGYVSELRRHLLSRKHRENERLMNPIQSPAKKVAMSKSPPLNDSRSIFICPIAKCNYSCVKGSSLLAHMKIHGIEQPEEVAVTKPKLSARQQDMLKKEAEKRKLAQQQQEEQKKQEEEFHIQQQQMIQQQKQQFQLQYQFQQNLVEENYSGNYGHDFECKRCHKTFLRESGLRKHGHYCNSFPTNDLVEQKEQPEVNSNSKDSFVSQKMHCPLCDLSFGSRSVFVSHVQIYHKGSNLENGLLKPLKKSSTMQASNKLRINNKKGLGFVCNICGKKFNLLSSLNFHLKSHSVSVKHICRICKEGFNARKAFMEHCRTHFLKAGSKETLCHKCFKVFKTRSELYYHRKNDMCSIKLKIYTCNLCQHSFKEPSALEEHRVVCHSESLDMSEDPPLSSSIGELYDDSFIPMNPLSLISPTNENLPGTSSKPLTISSNKSVPNYGNMNYSNKSSVSFNNKIKPVNFNPKSTGKSPFHCEICTTDYSTKQSLRKHIKKFHILNVPFIGSRKYTTARKSNILQANALKQWKCKHCKTAFGSRKILVLHLKKCQYNVLDLAKGMCLQCGKWCESGKTRICRFCLPDITKSTKTPKSNFLEVGPKLQRQEQFSNFQTYTTVKQEYPDEQIDEYLNDNFSGLQNPTAHFSEYSQYPTQQLSFSPEKFPMKMQNDHKEIPNQTDGTSQKNSAKQDLKKTINSINLMKCPIGNKYFRNEMTMIKHYSQCDGTCENRCSHCRKMFNSTKEYRNHLMNSKCFGPRRRESRLKYPSFGSKKKTSKASVKQDSSVISMSNNPECLTPSINEGEKIPDNSSDITVDMSVLESSISEESIGPESSASSSVNRILEEKSLRMGRVCTMCDKVITMQRAIYRHVYSCFKMFMLSQESVSCRKCCKTFSKHYSMKDNTANIKQHVLACHFIPYFVGEGLEEDGTRTNVPPPFLCYVCSFGFSSNTNLQKHIKEHRYRKDETNNIVLQLEDELLSEERLADEQNMHSLYVEPKNSNVYTVRTGRVLSLQDSPKPPIPGKKYFQCDKCSRNFTNRNKYLRHKKVHGIVKESVLHEVTDNVFEFMSDNVPSND